VSKDEPNGPNVRIPPLPPPEPRKELLTLQQRGALLRGVRMRQTQLHDECEALHARQAPPEQLESCLAELKLLEEGIAWLWRWTTLA
jgi:hypothetical protein